MKRTKKGKRARTGTRERLTGRRDVMGMRDATGIGQRRQRGIHKGIMIVDTGDGGNVLTEWRPARGRE